VEYKDENVFTDTRILCLTINCYKIHCFKETEDFSQEGIEKKKLNNNGFHPGRIT
jgi:hypothetical protein